MDTEIKILILEHNENDIGLILHQLKKAKISFVHEVAKDKASYETKLNSFAPDLILSDYTIPSFDAFAAYTMKQEICPEVPFIIVSGTVGEEKAVELIKSGVTDYVLKDKLFTLPGKVSRAMNESTEAQNKKIAEKALIENAARLSEAQSIAKIGNWEVNLVTKEEFWSDEIYHILGLKHGEIEPSLENFLSFIHPADLEDIKNRIIEAESQFLPFAYYTKIIGRDGAQRHVYSNGKYVYNKKGKPTRQFGILQDVTEIKKMEEALKSLNKELETFIYRASHDLRGPLSSIIGLINVSKAEITEEAPARYFKMIEASALKLDATLISLVQSMTMRDMVPDMEMISFDELIRGTLAQLKYHEGFSNVEITVKNEVTKEYLSNKLILSSVFQNLIQNAVKYQDYHTGQSFLNITISKKQRMIEMIFEDNGIGIDEHVQNKIFDMYFRGTSSVSGSGLGLYIIKTGIEKLGGTISFKSARGKGTTFMVHLPDNG